ncbi:o-methyltransferase domain-containing protein [Ditylenchus destructor]|uniref:O-methyltransferase domain-containing protein n=1 Tax=Ditylenchus destructor TaxID=166010 RepID=A0AAD4R776_9BILA|nr:o-methyltransferase domain-containing protein [Ditylenchus destructor]
MTSVVSKSYGKNSNEVINYCAKLTVKQSDPEKELQEATLNGSPMAGALGAPEVLQFGKNLIGLIGGKRCLDIGTFTGGSALAWATAVPEDGQVLTMDVKHEALNDIGMPILNKYPDLKDKISFHLGHALDKLDQLIASGESGQWDFAFIDADKENNFNYYKRIMNLLRPGGVILVDNALFGGMVCGLPHPHEREPNIAGEERKHHFSPEQAREKAKAIDESNRLIYEDSESRSALLNLGDGTHVAFKI